MKSDFFQETELLDIPRHELQQTAESIKQRFALRRSLYQQLAHRHATLDNWHYLVGEVQLFTEEFFNPWNNKWQALVKANDTDRYIEYFEEARKHFSQIEDRLRARLPSYSHTPEVDTLKAEVLSHIDSRLRALEEELANTVEKGIADVIGLKAEFGLQKHFQEHISIELEKSRSLKNKFGFLFVVGLTLIPVLLATTYFFDSGRSLVEQYSVRVGLVLSAGLLSYFGYSQYRLYQMVALRYTHLQGFLGGGATFLSQIIDVDDRELKREINMKLAELFMGLDDVFGLLRRNIHPADRSMDQVTKLLEQLAKMTRSPRLG